MITKHRNTYKENKQNLLARHFSRLMTGRNWAQINKKADRENLYMQLSIHKCAKVN
jgi:hypothetical protein